MALFNNIESLQPSFDQLHEDVLRPIIANLDFNDRVAVWLAVPPSTMLIIEQFIANDITSMQMDLIAGSRLFADCTTPNQLKYRIERIAFLLSTQPRICDLRIRYSHFRDVMDLFAKDDQYLQHLNYLSLQYVGPKKTFIQNIDSSAVKPLQNLPSSLVVFKRLTLVHCLLDRMFDAFLHQFCYFVQDLHLVEPVQEEISLAAIMGKMLNVRQVTLHAWDFLFKDLLSNELNFNFSILDVHVHTVNLRPAPFVLARMNRELDGVTIRHRAQYQHDVMHNFVPQWYRCYTEAMLRKKQREHAQRRAIEQERRQALELAMERERHAAEQQEIRQNREDLIEISQLVSWFEAEWSAVREAGMLSRRELERDQDNTTVHILMIPVYLLMLINWFYFGERPLIEYVKYKVSEYLN